MSWNPLPGEQAANPTPEQQEEGRRLVAEGWMQTSRKYRSVARVPPGMTAIEALRTVSPREAADLERRLEQWAADAFRRSHSKDPLVTENRLVLDIGTFAAFRKAGGESSF